MEKEDRMYLYGSNFICDIKQIIAQARQRAYTAINSAMVEAYWLMGNVCSKVKSGQITAKDSP